jgi:hypothetical protein
MATASDLTTYLDDARAAMDSDTPDIALARRKVALAKTVLAELPDVGSDGTTASYRGAIEALESAIRDLSAFGGAIVSQPLEFTE